MESDSTFQGPRLYWQCKMKALYSRLQLTLPDCSFHNIWAFVTQAEGRSATSEIWYPVEDLSKKTALTDWLHLNHWGSFRSYRWCWASTYQPSHDKHYPTCRHLVIDSRLVHLSWSFVFYEHLISSRDPSSSVWTQISFVWWCFWSERMLRSRQQITGH